LHFIGTTVAFTLGRCQLDSRGLVRHLAQRPVSTVRPSQKA